MCLFGAVDWSFDSECGERGLDPQGRDLPLFTSVQLGSTVMVSSKLHVSHCLIDLIYR